ncbi:hypothetical protein B0E54_06311 [Micromonospora sp. MH99]|nr:hypothetical protein [Micromonospora sp. MH99]
MQSDHASRLQPRGRGRGPCRRRHHLVRGLHARGPRQGHGRNRGLGLEDADSRLDRGAVPGPHRGSRRSTARVHLLDHRCRRSVLTAHRGRANPVGAQREGRHRRRTRPGAADAHQRCGRTDGRAPQRVRRRLLQVDRGRLDRRRSRRTPGDVRARCRRGRLQRPHVHRADRHRVHASAHLVRADPAEHRHRRDQGAAVRPDASGRGGGDDRHRTRDAGALHELADGGAALQAGRGDRLRGRVLDDR